MDGTILCQGSFLANFTGLTNPNPGVASRSNANAWVIRIPSNCDWLNVYNYTQYGTVGAAAGAYFNGTANADIATWSYWQRGMANGTGLVEYKAAATGVLSADTYVTGGFTLYNPSGEDPAALPVLGPAIAVTAVTNATRPVVSTANTAGLTVGSVVRLSNTAQTDINGVDMVVSAVTANTSFELLFANNALATAPGAIGGAGFYRIVNYYPQFYPRKLVVTNITQAVNAQVATSIANGFVPGQAVRFLIPAVSGMVQLNSTNQSRYLAATILTVVDDYTFTINVDTTGFTAFTFPTIAQEPCSLPEVVPVGEDTGSALTIPLNQVPTIAGQQIFNTQSGILSDATVNTGFLGMILGAGGNGLELTTPIIGPAGSITWSAGNVATPDTIYWVAGKSSFGGL